MAVDFETGSNQCATTADAAALDALTNLSVAVWYKPESVAGTYWLCYKQVGWVFGANGDDIYFRQYYSGDDGNWTKTNVLAAGTIVHMGVSYNRGGGTTIDPKLYVNGVSQTVAESGTPTGTVTADNGIFVVGGDDGTNCADGLLEDLRVYNRILTDQEFAILAAGYRGPLGGEVAWYRMDGAQATAHFDGATLTANTNYLTDSSGNGNHANPKANPVGAASAFPRLGLFID
jgi:hypothetical protein